MFMKMALKEVKSMMKIENDNYTKELCVKCELIFNLLNEDETKEEALERLVDLLNQNGVSIIINKSEIAWVYW